MNVFPARIHQQLLWSAGLILVALNGPSATAAKQDAMVESPVASVESLESQRKAAAENTAIEESVRAKIDELYGRAIDRTKESSTRQVRTRRLAEELSTVTETLKDEQQALDAVTPTTLPPLRPEETADDVTAQLTAARTSISEHQEELDTVESEIELRATRRTQLPTLRLEAQQELDALNKELSAPNPAGEPAEHTAARRALLLARQSSLQAELALIDQESRTYEATARLWSVRRDLAERRLKDAERMAASLQDRVAKIRQSEAGKAAQAARQVAAAAHPSVREAATRNADLAEENQETLNALETTRKQITEVTALQESLTADFKSLQKRAEAAGFSQAIGVLLRNQRNRLPDTAPYVQRSRERETKIANINLQLIEWETERNQLVDIEETVKTLLASLPRSLDEDERANIGEEFRAIISQQRELLSNTIENGNQYLDRLVALDSLEKALVKVADTQSDYIAEHVLWVKSAEPVNLAILVNTWISGKQIVLRSSWARTFQLLGEDVKTGWLTWAAFGLLVLWMILTRSRFRRSVRQDGELAVRAHATDMQPTFRAIVNSAILAALGPEIMGFLGWRTSTVSIGGFSQSVGVSLQVTAILWFGLEFIRQLIRKGGVCEKHFKWPDRSLTAIRRWLGTAIVVCLPAVWILTFSEMQDDNALQGSAGRLAFVLCAGVISTGLLQLLRAGGAVSRDLAMRRETTLMTRSHPIWSVLAILAPVGLAVSSLLGFHYSALQLAERLVISAGLFSGLILLYSFLTRWLLVTYRQLAINRSRQKREAILKEAAERGDDDVPAELSDAEAIPEVSLADVNQQTRRLIRMGAVLCAAIGLWLIWIDILPALGILRNVELWPNQIAAAVQSSSGESPPWVTLADLVLAIGGALLTFIAARNIPGLMEITILRRLPLDAGARYAASSLTRYLIGVIGVTLSFWLIGIGWSSVQWLIAAMTVGLGFGLQEIFANFVSGLILLFERPIRVGDTVTVNNITGTVSRIRIRATTILDWDNKELIVPNRAFVTDNLINWTLSTPHIRMILQVGVAYGSDTRKTTEVLYQVARESPQVLDDPEPLVVFDNFGDSSLNFELRLFVQGVSSWRRLRHELNMAIDDRFRAAGIEIAFPQRDLHVRSMPADPFGTLSSDSLTGSAIASDQL